MRFTSSCLAVATFAAAFVFAGPSEAQAQVVTAYYPATPAVSYVPVRRGLFGRRIEYRPVVSYPTAVAVAPAPVVAAPVTVNYVAPAAPVTVNYVAPAAPVTTTRVTTYYAPAAPVVVQRPVTTVVQQPVTTVVQQPVTTYYSPVVVSP